MTNSQYRPYWIAFILFCFAILIRLINIHQLPIMNDEIASIHESYTIGENLHGIPYFLLLKLMLFVDDSPLWIHSLSIILGSLTVPVFWFWLQSIRGLYVGLIATIFLILSPSAVEYSREVRFYPFWLLSSTLFYWRYWTYYQDQNRRNLQYLILASILVIVSHLLGVLIVLLTAVHYIIYTIKNKQLKQRLLHGFGVFVALSYFALLFVPVITAKSYAIFASVIARNSTIYTEPRGWSIVILAKLGLLVPSLTIGQFVHPLTFWIVIPTVLLFFIVLVVANFRLYNTAKPIMFFWIIVGIGGICTIYIFLEALLPSTFRDSASPKFVVFVIPLLFWATAEGIHAIPKIPVKWILLTAIVITQLIGLRFLYVAEWHSHFKSIELDKPIQHIRHQAIQNPTHIWSNGSAHSAIDYYLTDDVERITPLWAETPETITMPSSGTIFFSSNSDYAFIRCHDTSFLETLVHYEENYVFVDSKLFIYGYDLIQSNPTDNQTELRLPRTIYHPKFRDLELPQQFSWNSRQTEIRGMYTLPNCNGSKFWETTNLQMKGEQLTLFSNLTEANNAQNGIVVAQVILTFGSGNIEIIDIRKGYETQAWDKGCIEQCKPILTWHKRFALVGEARYPEAYHDFTASIFGVDLPIQNNEIRQIKIETSSGVNFHIWGVFIH